MKIITIVGARPQFVKAAAVSRELRRSHSEILLHTGQHYDHEMSQVFFDELDIPRPDINLEVGSGSHGAQTARMLDGIENVLMSQRPDWVLVYGDTNSTLAGALASAKLGIPIAHVEAGLRSFNRAMPEEINRVVTDHLSQLLLCSSRVGAQNLAAEGVTQGVHVVGDVMSDTLGRMRALLEPSPAVLGALGVQPGRYLLCTLHRSENTDETARLNEIVAALARITECVVLPLHPRTRQALARAGIALPGSVVCIDPVGYRDMVGLMSHARMILTDSGGIQKEAYWLGVPCITLRDETEWTETVDVGWNRLVGADGDRIVAAVTTFLPPAVHPSLYGDGNVAARCVAILEAAAKEPCNAFAN